MPTPLKLLLAEDNPHDAELMVREIRKAGFEPDWQRVETPEQFLAGLHPGLDLVISDYAMPVFNGLRALEILQQTGLEVPFILVSATIGEETAVAAIKQGATDYLMKDRLTRLGVAVHQALEQFRLRRERTRTDQALRKADAYLNQLVARSPTVLYSLKLDGLDGRLVYVSANISELAGFSAKEALGPGWWPACLNPADHDAARASLRLAVAQEVSRAEYRIRRKDGGEIWLEDRKRLLPAVDGETREIVGGWTDITARKEAEEARRKAEARYQNIIENAVDGIYQSTPDGRFLTVNPAMARILGYDSPRELIDDITDISSQLYVRPERRAEFKRQLHEEGTVIGFEVEMRRRDAKLIWTSTNARLARDEQGALLYEGLMEDITERKLLEEKFLRMQRVDAVGMLANGLAHDLNNILTPVLMAAGMLKEKLGDPRDREILEMVEQGAKRGAKIIGQLLNFSRGAEGERVSVQPKHMLTEMAQIMRETFPRNIAIESKIANQLWNVVADATQFHQVLMNLCVNARDAMPQGGKLTLGATNAHVGTVEAKSSVDAKPGPYVVVTVADTGSGIPPEIIDRIFDPFFSTKDVGKGTGLGLSTVQGIVRSHGGFMTVSSQTGQGSAFAVHLPATEEGAVIGPEPSAQPLPAGSGDLILVVDDEVDIRKVVRHTLEKNGYRALTAASGADALRIFVQYPGTVRAVLLDVSMPGMGGPALARALRIVEPGIKIIACSGGNQQEREAGIAALGQAEILLKPFTPADLLQTLDRVLRPSR